MIPEAAVEAACAIMVAKVHGITLDEASADAWGYERHVEREHAIELLEAAAPHLMRAQQSRIERVEALAEYPSTLTPEAAQLLRAALDPAA